MANDFNLSFGFAFHQTIFVGALGEPELSYNDKGDLVLKFGCWTKLPEWNSAKRAMDYVNTWCNFYLTAKPVTDRKDRNGDPIKTTLERIYQYMYKGQIVLVQFTPSQENGKPRVWEGKGGFAETGFGGDLQSITFLTGKQYKEARAALDWINQEGNGQIKTLWDQVKPVDDQPASPSGNSGSGLRMRPREESQPEPTQQQLAQPPLASGSVANVAVNGIPSTAAVWGADDDEE